MMLITMITILIIILAVPHHPDHHHHDLHLTAVILELWSSRVVRNP